MKGRVCYNLRDYRRSSETFVHRIETVLERKSKNGGDAQMLRESRKDLVRISARIRTPQEAWTLFQKHGGDSAPTPTKQLAE